MRPDWAIYCTLASHSKPLATINLPKSPTFLGYFFKGVKIIHFSSKFIFGKLLKTFGDFYLVPLRVSERTKYKDGFEKEKAREIARSNAFNALDFSSTSSSSLASVGTLPHFTLLRLSLSLTLSRAQNQRGTVIASLSLTHGVSDSLWPPVVP